MHPHTCMLPKSLTNRATTGDWSRVVFVNREMPYHWATISGLGNLLGPKIGFPNICSLSNSWEFLSSFFWMVLGIFFSFEFCFFATFRVVYLECRRRFPAIVEIFYRCIQFHANKSCCFCCESGGVHKHSFFCLCSQFHMLSLHVIFTNFLQRRIRYLLIASCTPKVPFFCYDTL